MHIPKYWARAVAMAHRPGMKDAPLVAWRWSDFSQAEADMEARRAAQFIAQEFSWGRPLNRYSYGERPLREQALHAAPGGMLTRNSYGAEILNTEQVMFADIDFPPPPTGLKSLFGGSGRDQKNQADSLQRVQAWAASRPELSMRVYRTAAGLRLLFTHQLYDPTGADVQDMLAGLGSDPLYARLCREQQCFRARLTPKPWRIGLTQTPPRYPQLAPKDQAALAAWLNRYQHHSQQYGVCRLLAELGRQDVEPTAAAIIALHDSKTCLDPNWPLA